MDTKLENAEMFINADTSLQLLIDSKDYNILHNMHIISQLLTPDSRTCDNVM